MESSYCMNCMAPLPEGLDKCPCCGFQEETYRSQLEAQSSQPLPLRHILNGKYMVGRIQGLLHTRYRYAYQGFQYIGLDLAAGKTVDIWEYAPDGDDPAGTRQPDGSILWDRALIQSRLAPYSRERSLGLSDLLLPFVLRGRQASLVRTTPAIYSHLETAYDIFEENGTAYVVCPHHNDYSLRHLLQLCGSLEPSEGLKMLGGVVQAVADLHAQGLTHGNITIDTILLKGSRLYLTGLGEPDGFRIPPLFDPQTIENEDGNFLRRRHFPAMDEAQITPATDVYQLCEVIYDCLIAGANDTDIVRNADSSVKLPQDINLILEIVLQKGLALHPSQRYPNAGELRAALEQVIG